MSNKNQKIKLRLGREDDGRDVAQIHYRAIHEIASNRSGLNYLSLHSSLTAEPFYRQNGFQRVKEGTHTLSTGEQMTCVVMRKQIS